MLGRETDGGNPTFVADEIKGREGIKREIKEMRKPHLFISQLGDIRPKI
jgi:hypothetical protein